MRALIISRKNREGYGGLNRFFAEFVAHYPKASLTISPRNFYNIFKIPFNRLDVIYLCDATLLPLGIILKTMLKKPLFVTAHGLDLTFPNHLYQLMLNKILPKSDGVILDSNPARKLISKFNLPKDKIFVINPGVSTDHLTNSKAIKLPNVKNKTVLLTVGNLVNRKGHVWFIKNVFPKLPHNFIYVVIGDGPKRDEITALIDNLHLKKRVILLGRLSNMQLSFVFKRADIYICPNQKEADNFESFGIATAEAVAMGLPVIASRVDGIPEAIKSGKNRLLVNPKPSSFIDALKDLKNLKKRPPKKYNNWEKSLQKYLEVFNTVSLASN